MKTIKYLVAMVGSFFSAFILINGLCFFYYRPPQNITNAQGFTSTKLKTGDYFITGTEGYGILTIDKNGFNNDGVVAPENAQIICIGSSQTEAAGVDTCENYVTKLNQIDPHLNAYNLGISGQSLASSFYRLPYLSKFYPSTRVIVAETASLPSISEWEKIAVTLETRCLPITNYDWKDGNIGMRVIRSMPYARLLFKNMQDLKKNNIIIKQSEPVFDYEKYELQVKRAFRALTQQMDGKPLIIVLVTFPQLQKDGRAFYIENKQTIIVREVCKENNIIFVDTAPYFLKEYKERRVLPNGFANSHIGKGHLNAEGYKILAKVLANLLKKEGIS